MRSCEKISLQEFTMAKQYILRHSERSEESKSRESKTNNKSMTQKRIGESHKFAQSKQIANNSKVAKIDSSLHGLRRFAQNDESYGLPRLAFASLAMTNLSQIYESLRDFCNVNSAHFVFARKQRDRSNLFFVILSVAKNPKNQSKVFGYFAYAQYDNKPKKE